MLKDKYKVLFFITSGILIVTIIIFSISFVHNNKKQIEEKNVVENKKEKQKAIPEENNITKDEIKINNDIDTKTLTYSEITTTQSDSEILDYLNEKKNEVSTKILDSAYTEKAKSIFIEIVDFIFYDGKIKNYTFKELTSEAKIETIKIATQIGTKIEEYQPGLIDSIGGKYTNVKSKLIELYDKKINEFCIEKQELCSNVREEYNNIKNSFNNLFNKTKGKISNLYKKKIKK